ncbi:peptide deformylase [Phascolarctobacterium sp.]|uniref:peptide deformylase n=1 Tax=Phascolarctobacterium sp. TaxID=2049039 RepID=UPI00386BFBEA
MAKKKTLDILVAGDPVLRQVAEPVDKIDKKLLHLLKQMAETMYAAEGVGLAAPQIGVSKRIVVIDVGEGLFELINPVIVKKEGAVVGSEGCLSVPDYEGEVERASYVECEFTDRTGRRMLLQAHDLFAICIQHELDHLDGVLFIDKAKSLSPKVKENPAKDLR